MSDIRVELKKQRIVQKLQEEQNIYIVFNRKMKRDNKTLDQIYVYLHLEFQLTL